MALPALRLSATCPKPSLRAIRRRVTSRGVSDAPMVLPARSATAASPACPSVQNPPVLTVRQTKMKQTWTVVGQPVRPAAEMDRAVRPVRIAYPAFVWMACAIQQVARTVSSTEMKPASTVVAYAQHAVTDYRAGSTVIVKVDSATRIPALWAVAQTASKMETKATSIAVAANAKRVQMGRSAKQKPIVPAEFAWPTNARQPPVMTRYKMAAKQMSTAEGPAPHVETALHAMLHPTAVALYAS